MHSAGVLPVGVATRETRGRRSWAFCGVTLRNRLLPRLIRVSRHPRKSAGASFSRLAALLQFAVGPTDLKGDRNVLIVAITEEPSMIPGEGRLDLPF